MRTHTYETILEDSKKYNNTAEWRNKDISSYNSTYRIGMKPSDFLPKVKNNTPPTKFNMSTDELVKLAKSYGDSDNLRKTNKPLYDVLYRRGLKVSDVLPRVTKEQLRKKEKLKKHGNVLKIVDNKSIPLTKSLDVNKENFLKKTIKFFKSIINPNADHSFNNNNVDTKKHDYQYKLDNGFSKNNKISISEQRINHLKNLNNDKLLKMAIESYKGCDGLSAWRSNKITNNEIAKVLIEKNIYNKFKKKCGIKDRNTLMKNNMDRIENMLIQTPMTLQDLYKFNYQDAQYIDNKRHFKRNLREKGILLYKKRTKNYESYNDKDTVNPKNIKIILMYDTFRDLYDNVTYQKYKLLINNDRYFELMSSTYKDNIIPICLRIDTEILKEYVLRSTKKYLTHESWRTNNKILSELVNKDNSIKIKKYFRPLTELTTDELQHLKNNGNLSKRGISILNKKLNIKPNKAKPKYSQEEVISISFKYPSRIAWRVHDRASYNLARKWGILNLCKGQYKITDSKRLKCVYSIYFKSGFAYIGVTCNYKERTQSHLRMDNTFDGEYAKKRSAVREHLFKVGGEIACIELLTPLEIPQNRIKEYENFYIQLFIKKGYKMLNKISGGGIGNVGGKWSINKLRKKVKEFNNLEEYLNSDIVKYAEQFNIHAELILHFVEN